MARLCITLVLTLLLFTFSVAAVSAQIPYIQAYFCPTSLNINCQGVGAESQLCIYTHNFHATYNAVEFAVSYPAAVSWVSDHNVDAHVGPRQFSRVANRQGTNALAIHNEIVVVERDRAVEATVDAVVL